MPFKIIGIDVLASYDAMPRSPGDMRPLPTLVSARLAEQVALSVRLMDVASAATGGASLSGDLTLAMFKARERVVKLMNSHLIGAPPFAVDLDSDSVEYRPTSTGGHQTISWLKKVAPAGTTEFWQTDLEIQGDVIHAYACLAISLRETSPSGVPI